MKVEIEEILGLSKREIRVMYSIQYWLTLKDIESTIDNEILKKKTEWINEWKSIIFEKKLFGLLGEEAPQSLEDLQHRISSIDNNQKKLIIFCESLVFTPYFNLKKSYSLKKTISVQDRNSWKSRLLEICDSTDSNPKDVIKWEENYLNSLKSIAGRSEIFGKVAIVAIATIALGVTGGVAAPAIGGLVGGMMGLSGAAATSAGLALLGGGAIAAGGFGMAGGTIAIIGGGAAIGGFGSWAFSRSFYLQNKLVLSQLAKLDSTLRVISIEKQNHLALIIRCIDKYTEALTDLIKELSDEEVDSSDKKLLKKTSLYYENAIDRLNTLKIEILKS